MNVSLAGKMMITERDEISSFILSVRVDDSEQQSLPLGKEKH